MNLKGLSNKNLLSTTKDLVARERGITLEIIEHLQEIETRSLFAQAAFPSLFEYVVKELGYSESAAQRRISALRLIKTQPELKEKIKEGELTLSTLALAQSFFRAEGIQDAELKKDLLKELERKSARQVEKHLADRSQNPQKLRVDRVKPVSPNLSQISLMVDDEFVSLLDELKNLRGHGKTIVSIKELLLFALKDSVGRLRPKAPKVGPLPTSEVGTQGYVAERATVELPPPVVSSKMDRTKQSSASRFIPVEIKRQVWARDQGECSYHDPQTGRKCATKYGLEFDHIEAFAKGGKAETKNLRLRCRAHNLLWAQQTFGEEHMRRYVPRMQR